MINKCKQLINLSGKSKFLIRISTIFLVIFALFIPKIMANDQHFSSKGIVKNSSSFGKSCETDADCQENSDEKYAESLICELPKNIQQSDNFSLSTKDLNLSLPFSIAATYSKFSGYTVIGKMGWLFNDDNAFQMDLEIGETQGRYSATLGHVLSLKQRIKATAEYLDQKINFDFTSYGAKEWVGQMAYGLEYQYVFPHSLINALNIGVTYSKASDKQLSAVNFYDNNGLLNINLRHIAAGTDKNANVGINILPSKNNLLKLRVDYDSVNYAMNYNNAPNNTGVGATANFEQLLSDHVKLKLNASNRTIADDYSMELDWLLNTDTDKRVELGLTGEYSKVKSGMPSKDYIFGLKINYVLEAGRAKTIPVYTLGSENAIADLLDWTAIPAVRMPQVLAIKDEAVIQALQLLNVFPAEGSTNGGDLVTLYGHGLVGNNLSSGFKPTIVFGDTTVSPSKIISFNNSTISLLTPPHPVGTVDIKLTRIDGLSASLVNGFTYKTKPSISPTVINVQPPQGPIAGNTAVTITGTGFLANASVKFGNNAATNVSVINSTTITCKTPASTTGAAAVTVTVTNTDSQSGSLVNAYTYQQSTGPTISSVSRFNSSTALVLNQGGILPTSNPIIIAGNDFSAGQQLYLRNIQTTSQTITGLTSTYDSSTGFHISAIPSTNGNYNGDWKVCLQINPAAISDTDPCSSSDQKVSFINTNFSVENADFTQTDPSLTKKNAALMSGGDTLKIHASQPGFKFESSSSVIFDSISVNGIGSDSTVRIQTPAHAYGSINQIVVYNGNNAESEHSLANDLSNEKLGFYRVKYVCQSYSGVLCSTTPGTFRADQNYSFDIDDSDRTTCQTHYYQGGFDHMTVFGTGEIDCANKTDLGAETVAYHNTTPFPVNMASDIRYHGSSTVLTGYCQDTPENCAYIYTLAP